MPKAKVVSIAKARAKRDIGDVRAFQPSSLEDIVGTCTGLDTPARVALKAPPPGCGMWAWSPEQAREIAKQLNAYADYVDEQAAEKAAEEAEGAARGSESIRATSEAWDTDKEGA
jgi:hypothetical protein